MDHGTVFQMDGVGILKKEPLEVNGRKQWVFLLLSI